MALTKVAKVITGLMLTVIILLVAAYYYIFSFYMPQYFGNHVIPRLADEAGIRGFSGKVKRVGVFGADLGQLSIGDTENPALKVESVIIRYKPQSLFSLKRLKINRITLRGVELKCRIRQNKIEINHVNLEKFIQLIRKNFGHSSKSGTGTLAQAKLSISDSKLYIDSSGANHVIPFSLKLKPLKADWSNFEANIKFHRKLYDIDSLLVFNLKDNIAEIAYRLDLQINKLKELFSCLSQWKLPENLNVRGSARVEGVLCIGLEDIKLLRLKCHGVSKDAEFSYGSLRMRNRLKASGIPQQLEFILEKTVGGPFYLRFKNVLCRKPFNLFLPDVRLDFPSVTSMPITAGGQVKLDLRSMGRLFGYTTRMVGGTSVSRNFKGRFEQQSGSWYFRTFDNGGKKNRGGRFIFDFRGFNTFCELRDLSIIGHGIRNNGSLAFNGLLDNFTACRSGKAVFGSGLKFLSNLKIGPDKNGGFRLLANKFNFTLPALSISSAAESMQFSDLEISGSNKFKGTTLNRLSAKLKLRKFVLKKADEVISSEAAETGLEAYYDSVARLWSCAVRAETGKILSVKSASSYLLKDLSLSSYLKISGGDFDQLSIKNCSINSNVKSFSAKIHDVKIDSGKSELGLYLNFNRSQTLLSARYNGKADSINASFNNERLDLWKIDIAGDMNGTQERILAGEPGEFLNSFQVGKMELKSSVGADKLQIADATVQVRCLPDNVGEVLKLPAKLIATGKFATVSGVWNNKDFFCSKPRLELSLNKNYSGFSDSDFKIAVKAEETGWGSCQNGIFADKIEVFFNRDSKHKSQLQDGFELKIKRLFAQNQVAVVSFPSFQCKGRRQKSTVSARIKAEKGNLNFGRKFIMENLNFDLPLQSGYKNVKAKGRFNADQLVLGQFPLGAITGTASAGNGDLTLAGNTGKKGLLSGFLSFRGDKTEFSLNLKRPLCKLAAPLKFDIASGVSSVQVSGGLGYDFKVAGSRSGISDTGSIKLANAALKTSGWQLKGVSGICKFSDFSNRISMPHQFLKAEVMRTGNCKIRNCQFYYQLSEKNRVYLENSAFEWLGGRFQSLAPFIAGTAAYIDFQADNIMLESLLKYINLKSVSSDAFISGGVKLGINDFGNITFHKSRLFSTPGQNGILRLPDVAAYMGSGNDFAAAVLRRFNYDWIKLRLDMEKSGTGLQLDIYGRPARKVPFVRDESRQGFVRTGDENIGISGKMTLKAGFVLPSCDNKE
ncbi:YdbH domain-containing protein [Lentisphaerota bacterium ZTH]|nr:YdbH domain-containing protein [Lentisphaerota bacterium]WET07361.1 YdbH domain-containing protein [Lentisphaerota bacterium ZTH]